MSKADLEKTNEELAVDLFELREQESLPYLSESRKAEIRLKMARKSWELTQRNIPLLESAP